MNKLVATIFAATLLFVSIEANNQPLGHILFYFPIIPNSAILTFMPVAEKLAQRGHKVTVVSPFQSKGPSVPNLTEIIFPDGDFIKIAEQTNEDPWKRGQYSFTDYLKIWISAYTKYLRLVEQSLEVKEIKDLWMIGSPKIDIVISMPITGNEISFYLAHRWNATMVEWSSQQVPISVYDYAIGQPHNTAHIGHFLTTNRHPMSFRQRVGNTLVNFGFQFLRDKFMMVPLESIIDSHFPDDLHRPSLFELEKKIGLALQFGHPLILDGLRPTVPNFVTVGMMNCRPPKTLPEKLKTFMDESGDKGVILVSFGSVLKASTMPESKRQLLLNVFRRLDQHIIWKWETEVMEDKPPNVLLSKWLPQQDVLGHPKLRLFVTHGGQSSCQESLCHQKPMVVVPVFADQPANGLEAEVKGYGISVPLEEMTEETLYNAIRTVLDDPKYSIRAKEHGDLLMDDINKPLDRAIWWLEYALRHPGMEHLRSPLHDLEWYQLALLDVFGFIFVIVFIVGFLLFKLCKLIFKKKSSNKEKHE